VPMLAYFAIGLVVRRQRRFATDIRFARSHRALRLGLQRLDEARGAPQPVDDLYHAVTSYLADEFNLPETGMTSADTRQILDARHIPEDIAAGLTRILKTCERARYAAETLSQDEVFALTEGARAVMERLDNFQKRSVHA
ncbi:MAG: hypothetical protein SGI88_13990, partial [Candidatus Hydrogenedentes bacterium]|nr:hypothetical protein [Candidatus Hydrogenedentota bacterium]